MRGAGAYGGPSPSSSKLSKTLDLYFQICSIEINTQLGAIMACTLANGGICPTNSKQIFDYGNGARLYFLDVYLWYV